MKNLSKRNRKLVLDEALSILSEVFGFRVTLRYAQSKIFIVHLRNKIYQNQEQKIQVLHAYNDIVLTAKIKKQVFYVGSLDENSKHIVDEYRNDGGEICPKWYFESAIKDVPARNNLSANL
jgi:hypothetical protein